MGRKAESALVITASILAFFVFVSFIFYTQIGTLQSRIGTLQSRKQQLESEVHEKDQLIYYLEHKRDTLENQIHSLETEVEGLQDLIELYEQVPPNYYETDIFPNMQNTLDALEYFINKKLRIPATLRDADFDCSEWSACLEWILEDAGFDARIVCGPTPWGGDTYHAWILVYTEDYQVVIEATDPHIVYSNDEFGYEYYHGYDKSYRTVYLAIEDYGTAREWDWWVSGWGVFWSIG